MSDFGIFSLDAGDYSGDPFSSQAVGIDTNTAFGSVGGLLAGDVTDAQAMDRWNPAPAQAAGAPWWAGIATYGIGRAIDNQFPGSPTGIGGNTYPGSGAGSNGRTYNMRPAGAGGGVGGAKVAVRSPLGDLNGRMSPGMVLMLGLAVAYVVLR